jgi:O-glycosyl hydrolase
MKKKTFAGLLISILLMSALVFSACQMDVAGDLIVKPITRPHISLQPASASYFMGESVLDLTAQVWDWDDKNGTLSFSWFMFDDIASFISTGRGNPVPGAVNIETIVSDGMNVINIPLSLSGITPEAGKRFFYYLEITNKDNTATDMKEVTIRSEMATISFSNAGSPLIPRIDRHPANASYQFGRNLIMHELSVRAVAVDDGELTYQWFHNTSGSIADENLILIPGATGPTYGPTLDRLSAGNNFFFAQVTNTINANTVTILSIPSIITMGTGRTALDPIILRHPNDAIYFTGDFIRPLSIEVEPAIDGGTISYQWYSNTRQEGRGGTIIPGQTRTTFTPPATAQGITYYYVVVTNNNPAVTSNVKTASVSSMPAKVVITTPAAVTANLTVTVADPRLPQNRYQYIRGYGGMDVGWANFPEQKPEDMETMFNPDWGLGYNINRIMIMPWNTNVNIMMRDLTNSHRPHYYENVRIVNKYNGYNAAAPWSMPREWKSNNSINGGGFLVRSYYRQYAEYLRAFAKHMYDAGAPIYTISIQNEPNYVAGYDGCEWTPEQMRDFFIEVGHFTTGIRGFGGGREIPHVLTMNGESANCPFINVPALRDQRSRGVIDLYARHVYGSVRNTLWKVMPDGSVSSEANPNSTIQNILTRPDGTKKEVWMTEHNINSANAIAFPNDSTWNFVWRFMNDVDLVMRLNNENAFVWWASKRFYSMIGDGQFGTADGVPLPRGYGLSHYAKYTIDTHRIDIGVSGTLANGTPVPHIERNNSLINSQSFNLDNNTPRITAYALIQSGRDNQPITPNQTDFSEIDFLSLVMMTPTNTNGSGGVNVGTIRIQMPPGFLIGGVSAHKSTSAVNIFRAHEVQISDDRSSAFVTLNAGEILSVKFTRQ